MRSANCCLVRHRASLIIFKEIGLNRFMANCILPTIYACQGKFTWYIRIIFMGTKMLKELIASKLQPPSGTGNLSQRELAKGVGVSLGTIQNALYGYVEFKKETKIKFSQYFKKPIPDLFPGTFITQPVQDETYMMKEIIRLKNDIIDLGREIGDIKSHLITAGRTGNIKELMLIDGGKK